MTASVDHLGSIIEAFERAFEFFRDIPAGTTS